jgi:hypothetical protein
MIVTITMIMVIMIDVSDDYCNHDGDDNNHYGDDDDYHVYDVGDDDDHDHDN